MPPAKIAISLSADDRAALERLTRTGEYPAAAPTRARILLKADAAGPDAWPDGRIAEALGVSRVTAQRVRQQFAREGPDATPHREKPAGRRYRRLDGAQEARPVALARSEPPPGRARWAMRLLADALVELEVAASIGPATVCRTLQKTTSSCGSGGSGSSRRGRAGRS